jgi:2'-5' RNA ligase
MQRLFIALDFPGEVTDQLGNLCHSVRGARWVPLDQMHLTLQFIGETDDETAGYATECLALVNYTSFGLRLASTGFFPPRGNPRTLWAGVEKSAELVELYDLTNSCLDNAGIAHEKRKFHPHVTLARLRDSVLPEDIVPFLAGTSLFKTDPVLISEFHLYSSVLKPEGPVHYREASYDLH